VERRRQLPQLRPPRPLLHQTRRKRLLEIKTDIGVDGKTIKIGLLADLTGPFGVLVQDIVDAQQVYWDGVNAAGGLTDGYTVELVARDTTRRSTLS